MNTAKFNEISKEGLRTVMGGNFYLCTCSGGESVTCSEDLRELSCCTTHYPSSTSIDCGEDPIMT